MKEGSEQGIEWRDMRRDKVTRSMKTATVDKGEDGGSMHVRFAAVVDEHK